MDAFIVAVVVAVACMFYMNNCQEGNASRCRSLFSGIESTASISSFFSTVMLSMFASFPQRQYALHFKAQWGRAEDVKY